MTNVNMATSGTGVNGARRVGEHVGGYRNGWILWRKGSAYNHPSGDGACGLEYVKGISM